MISLNGQFHLNTDILYGDKSVSHRALMLAAIADGECVIRNVSTSDDVLSTARCLETLGAKISFEGATARECKRPLQLIADKVGSTAALLEFAQKDDAKEYIVVTESGILFEMRNKCPEKEFLAAPAEDAECQCNECDFMKMNTLQKVYECLRDETPEIKVDEETASLAVRPINRMLEMS